MLISTRCSILASRKDGPRSTAQENGRTSLQYIRRKRHNLPCSPSSRAQERWLHHLHTCLCNNFTSWQPSIARRAQKESVLFLENVRVPVLLVERSNRTSLQSMFKDGGQIDTIWDFFLALSGVFLHICFTGYPDARFLFYKEDTPSTRFAMLLRLVQIDWPFPCLLNRPRAFLLSTLYLYILRVSVIGSL